MRSHACGTAAALPTLPAPPSPSGYLQFRAVGAEEAHAGRGHARAAAVVTGDGRSGVARGDAACHVQAGLHLHTQRARKNGVCVCAARVCVSVRRRVVCKGTGGGVCVGGGRTKRIGLDSLVVLEGTCTACNLRLPSGCRAEGCRASGVRCWGWWWWVHVCPLVCGASECTAASSVPGQRRTRRQAGATPRTAAPQSWCT